MHVIDDFRRWWVLIVVWACFCPVVLLVPAGYRTVQDTKAFWDPLRTSSLSATIVDRRFHRGSYEVRYAFSIGDRVYGTTDEFGREDPWTEINTSTWRALKAGQNLLPVTYLREKPEINRPSRYATNISERADVAQSWALLMFCVAMTLGWLFAGELLRRFIVKYRPVAVADAY